ncbi:hypothetical protein ACHAW5_004735 [Stephanodiscus triporus]|uniref:Thioredoxin domain-containing protein n=1 Tax=Stephanodiscus triporus TaxID=2934178 RepID=A0ABD3PG98_9STRA
MIITEENPAGGSSMLQLLRSRHQCYKYMSNLNVKNDGILFGPGKAISYVKSIESMSYNKCQNLIPSPDFGLFTVQILLENNSYSPPKVPNRQPLEITQVLASVLGCPCQRRKIWMNRSKSSNCNFNQRTRVGSKGGMDKKEMQRQSTADNQNPYVTQIVGVEGLAEIIISKRQNCIVFVAMQSCWTCKSINTMFTKMAREHVGGELLFAKADATGASGKALGKQLGIVAVPSFVLFRNGIRYDAVFMSKLPSDRLDKAIRDLEAGEDFDTSLVEEEND